MSAKTSKPPNPKKKLFSEQYREDKARGLNYPGVSDSIREHLNILEEGNSRSDRNMHIRCT